MIVFVLIYHHLQTSYGLFPYCLAFKVPNKIKILFGLILSILGSAYIVAYDLICFNVGMVSLILKQFTVYHQTQVGISQALDTLLLSLDIFVGYYYHNTMYYYPFNFLILLGTFSILNWLNGVRFYLMSMTQPKLSSYDKPIYITSTSW